MIKGYQIYYFEELSSVLKTLTVPVELKDSAVELIKENGIKGICSESMV